MFDVIKKKTEEDIAAKLAYHIFTCKYALCSKEKIERNFGYSSFCTEAYI